MIRALVLLASLTLAGCAGLTAPDEHQESLREPDVSGSVGASAQASRPPLRRILTQDGAVPAQQKPSDAAKAAPAKGEPPKAGATMIRGNDRMFANPASPPQTPLAGEAVSLKFEQAPVTEVVHAVLGEILGLPYVINQPVTGTVTLHTHNPLPRDKIFSVFEALLQANGLLVVKDSAGVFHVGRPEALKGVAPNFGRVGNLPPGHNLVIVPLQYVGAAEMADILKPLANPEAFVRIDTFRNILILAGARTQVDGWMEIVNAFDIDLLKGMSVGLFPLKHTSAKDIDAGLKAVMSGAAGTVSPASSAPSRPSANAQTQAKTPAGAAAAPVEASAVQLPGPVAGVVRIVALERLNALLVITPRAHYLDIAKEWIEKFDQPRTGGSEPQLYVYPVQNGTAQHLASLLNAVFGGESGQQNQQARTNRSVAPGLGMGSLGTGPFGASGTSSSGNRMSSGSRLGSSEAGAGAGEISQVTLGEQVRVVADDQNNALLIYAPPSEYTKIESALRRLDIAPTQVLIEASILEVTLTNELKYGLQWYFNDSIGNNKGWSGAGQLTSGTSSTIGVTNPGFSYSITNPLGQIRAVLNALASKSLINVISSPSVMVLDNHTAQIHVGDQQPVRSSSTITEGGTTVNSIQYKDTGVMLGVSPSVNAGGMVTMTIEQSVTDVGQVDQATGQRAFLQRQISSRVAVRSGETIVLGGLIRDNKSRDKQGIPLLHDIPMVGNLFGATEDATTRTELLVMLTPKVINSDSDLRVIGDELKSRMRSLEMMPERIGAPGGPAPRDEGKAR